VHLDVTARNRDHEGVAHVRRGLRGDLVLEDRRVRRLGHPPEDEIVRLPAGHPGAFRFHRGLGSFRRVWVRRRKNRRGRTIKGLLDGSQNRYSEESVLEPGSAGAADRIGGHMDSAPRARIHVIAGLARWARSEEHTSELQSRFDIVCRLLHEKKYQEWIIRSQIIEHRMYLLWDIGFKLGHSTLAFIAAIAADNADMMTKTAMLEVHLFTGDLE